MSTGTDGFWERLNIPYQEDNDDFQFVNPVVVARQFVKAVGEATTLGNMAEVLTEQLANLKVQLDRKERELRSFRREVFSKHYKEITRSAGSEIQDAFLRNKAEEDGRLPELLSLEADIESLRKEIEVREPRVDQYRLRLKMMETIMVWGKQYLDYEKLVTRTHGHS